MNQRYDVLGFGLVILGFALFAWTGISGPILEFGPKNFLYEYQTLIGGILAVAAAIFAVRPAYKQLGELRLQSRQREIERLAARSVQLNEDRIAMFSIWSMAEVFSEELKTVLTNVRLTQDGRQAALHRLDAALEQLSKRIEVVHGRRGHHWGGVAVHDVRNECIDTALRLGSIAHKANRRPMPDLLEQFEEQRTRGMQLAAALETAAKYEMSRVAALIGDLERSHHHGTSIR